MPDLAGQLLSGRYTLVQRIGWGGMGVIYLADDAQLPRAVAIKILLSDEPAAEQRFLDEIEILATVVHPSLVVPHGKGRTPGGQLYMAMEYIRGENLRERLLEVGPLSCREALAVGITVGEVLLVLHAAGVLHRDIKPGNIMLVASGAAVIVKLIDLGCAKKQAPHWPAGPSGRFETCAGVPVGTPAYLAPEAGHVPADPRLDVYALAATIYELCTGKVPSACEAYRPIQAPLGDCPPELDAVLAAALALDVAARTPTIEALVAGLIRVRDANRPGPLFDGRYELLRSLGKGGKGEVWLAAHRHTGRDGALKRLHPKRHTEEEVARLRREARVLAALQHPAFPTLYDCHEHEGRPYLVMARARGEPASKYIQHPLSPAHVVEVGIQLARGLLALHGLGVLHRDLNNSNVLIDFEAAPVSRPVVTIIDLGQCELLPVWYAREQRYATPPERRTSLGSGGLEQFPWTAPEARRGAGWSEKSDVWSAGHLLFQLLTGRVPFAPGSDEPISPRTYLPDCDSDLAFALLAALNPDPSKRLDAAGLLQRLVDVAELQAEIAKAEARSLAPAPAIHEAVPEDSPGESGSSPATSARNGAAPTENETAILATPSPAPTHEVESPLCRVDRAELRGAPAGVGLRRIVLVGTAGLLSALFIGMWASSEEPAPAPVMAAISASTRPAVVEPVPVPTPVLLPAADVVEAARPALRGCAAGTRVTIDVAASEGTFTALDVLGSESAASCARSVIASLRSAPGPSQRFTVEIVP